MKKDILNLLDLQKDEVLWLIQRCKYYKSRYKNGQTEDCLKGKVLGLLFEKASTRTRLSFESAMLQMGGGSIFINSKDSQLSRNEPISDTARVLSGYLDVLAVRTYSQDIVNEFAAYASIPVINALTDKYHPCQILSDIFTVIENKDRYNDLKIAWIGDGNNVAHSWINIASILGLNLHIACPKGFYPDKQIIEDSLSKRCGQIKITEDPYEALFDADVINTDVWASMGQEEETEHRKKIFQPYQINKDIIKNAKEDCIILHCLPAHRGEEITDDIIESKNSVIWEQAENKLHMHKAVLELLVLNKS